MFLMPRATLGALLVILTIVVAVSCGRDSPVMPFLLQSAESQIVKTELCIVDEETRERIRNIMMDALDEALHDQIKTLFIVMLKDERGQPDRAKVGVRQAIKAHQQARQGALDWMPPICSG